MTENKESRKKAKDSAEPESNISESVPPAQEDNNVKSTEGSSAKNEKAEVSEAEDSVRAEELLKIKIEALQKELATKQDEIDGLNDRYLRMAAEYDNFKKRTQKEKEELSILSKNELLKQLLPVFDNIERASDIKNSDMLSEGLALILKSFKQVLDKNGIKEIDILGKEFDPILCEALAHVDDDDKPENTVCEILQKGYVYGDKVIRHALVKVVN